MNSISPNGAPLGTQSVKDLADSPSWRSPTEYVDPTTGKTWSAPTLAELLDLLEANDVKLFDREEMLGQGMSTARGLAPKFDPSVEWERLIIHLDTYTDPERAREIIVHALANPDFSISETKGGKYRRNFDFKGRRAVIAHEVHHRDERGPHFLAQIHISGLDAEGNILPRASIKKSEHWEPMVAQINRELAAAGLAEIKFVSRGAENGVVEAERRAQLTPQQAEEYREATTKGELPPLLVEDKAAELVDAMPASARKEALRVAAEQASTQAAQLWAQAQGLQKQNHLYRQALRALESEEQHLARIASLNTKLEEAATNAATAEAQHAATIAEQAQAVESATAQVVEVSATLEATQAHAAQVSEQLTDTREKLAGVEADLAQATEAGEQLEQRLEQTQGKLAQVETVAEESKTLAAGLQKALDAERTARTNDTKAYEQELGEVRAALTIEQKARGNLERQLEKSRADLADERTAHGATKGELKTETKRADSAERAADKAQAELAAMREQLAAAQAQLKTQGQDLARERTAREEAERAARDALGAKATAEAQLAARPSQADLQAALADKAKAEGQRDQLRERLEAVLAERKPAPGNGNGPQA